MHVPALLLVLPFVAAFGVLFLGIQLASGQDAVLCPTCSVKNSLPRPVCSCCGREDVLLGASGSTVCSTLAPEGVLFLACNSCSTVTLHVARCACGTDLTALAAEMDLMRFRPVASDAQIRVASMEVLALNDYAPMHTHQEAAIA